MKNIPTEFVFELSAKGEKIIFREAEEISTKVTLPGNINKGENPFKFRIPSFPKTGKLTLHQGSASNQSKLMGWFRPSKDEGGERKARERISLTLKSKEGQPFVEWIMYNAFPVNMKSSSQGNAGDTAIDDLELNFSFYSLTMM